MMPRIKTLIKRRDLLLSKVQEVREEIRHQKEVEKRARVVVRKKQQSKRDKETIRIYGGIELFLKTFSGSGVYDPDRGGSCDHTWTYKPHEKLVLSLGGTPRPRVVRCSLTGKFPIDGKMYCGIHKNSIVKYPNAPRSAFPQS